MIIKLNEIFKIETILKDEKAGYPIKSHAWSTETAKENGINVSFGHREEIGVFIPESVLREIMEVFDNVEKNIDNSNPGDDNSTE